jgi:transposase
VTLFVGDDWAERHHDAEVVDDAGRLLARRRLPEGLEGVTRLRALIAEQMLDDWADLDAGEAAALVKVGIETDRGTWVGALVAAGYEVFGINPLSVARYRERNSTSGAKSDARTRTCGPRSSGWTGAIIGRWPPTPMRVQRSS